MEFKGGRVYFDDQDKKRAPILKNAGDSVGAYEALILSEEIHKHIREYDELDRKIGEAVFDSDEGETARLRLAEITFNSGNNFRDISHEFDIYVESMKISDIIADEFYIFRSGLEQE